MRRALVALALSLTACSSPGSAAVAPELTVEYGCGYGFWIGSSDQTAGMFVEYTDYEAAADGDVVESATLSSGSWGARLEMGSDLFANWCDDVLEPDEPEAVVTETWEVSGSIEVTKLPPNGQCGPAAATLTDLIAVDEQGVEVRLGDFDLRNEFWGCFAG